MIGNLSVIAIKIFVIGYNPGYDSESGKVNNTTILLFATATHRVHVGAFSVPEYTWRLRGKMMGIKNKDEHDVQLTFC